MIENKCDLNGIYSSTKSRKHDSSTPPYLLVYLTCADDSSRSALSY